MDGRAISELTARDRVGRRVRRDPCRPAPMHAWCGYPPGPSYLRANPAENFLSFMRQMRSVLTDSAASADSLLSELLRGKHVVVVGPAGYLQHRDVSRLVESADIVVRPNVKQTETGFLQLAPHTSSRCDIVYHGGLYAGRPLDGVVDGQMRTIRTPARIGLGNESLHAFRAHGVRALVLASLKADRLQHFLCLDAPAGMRLAATPQDGEPRV